VTETLLEYCDHVVLTVDPNNTPAVAAYARLGYREVCHLVEASAARRDTVGGGVGVPADSCRNRGRKYDGSLVSLRD